MTYKAIEVYYDIASIPEITDPERDLAAALDFRNAAMELIENKLAEADLGEEIGSGEVNFGFEVEDFDAAEAAVRAAVDGTPFAGIREITRHQEDDDTA